MSLDNSVDAVLIGIFDEGLKGLERVFGVENIKKEDKEHASMLQTAGGVAVGTALAVPLTSAGGAFGGLAGFISGACFLAATATKSIGGAVGVAALGALGGVPTFIGISAVVGALVGGGICTYKAFDIGLKLAGKWGKESFEERKTEEKELLNLHGQMKIQERMERKAARREEMEGGKQIQKGVGAQTV